MNLLEIFEENQKRIEEENQQDSERKLNKEIREIKAEIIEGEIIHYTDNKEIFNMLDIKCKKNFTSCVAPIFFDTKSYRKYYFDYNRTNIKKIQKYIDKQLEQN